MAATAATAAMPSTCGDGSAPPVLVLPAERDTFSVVRLIDFKLLPHGLSRAQAEACCNGCVPDSAGRIAMIVKESDQVTLAGAPFAPKPPSEAPYFAEKAAKAHRLEQFTGGRSRFSHDPVACHAGDADSIGHRFFVTPNGDDEFIYLDQRKPGSMKAQLVDKLRRVAGLYMLWADDLEEQLGPGRLLSMSRSGLACLAGKLVAPTGRRSKRGYRNVGTEGLREQVRQGELRPAVDRPAD